MANDPTQDPDFLKASPEDQHSYLMSADPDYAKASPSDQNAYLNTFSKTNQTLGQVPNAATQAKSQLPTPRGVDILGRTDPETLPEKEAKMTPAQRGREASGESMALPATMMSMATVPAQLIRSPLPTLGKLATSIGSGAALGGAGRFATRELGGGETAQNIVGTATGLLGSALGWREPPSRIGFRGIGMDIPESLRPEGAAHDAQQALGAFMNKGYKPVPPPAPELGSPENPGWVAPLPNKMPSVTDPVTQAVREGRAARIPSKMPSVTDPVTQAVREGRASVVPTRMPEQTAQVDPVAAAVRRGDAARLPIRMPKPASITEASPNPLRGMQSTAPSEVANLPPAEVRPSITSSPESTTGPSAKVMLKGEKTPKSSIVSPDSPAPKVQGSYWSFKESALRQAVLGGDRDAAMVYKERFGSLPEGASYLTDVGNKPNRGLYRSDR